MLLCRCIQLTDDGAVPLAEACGRLELLSLHGIQGITDRRAPAPCWHLHAADAAMSRDTPCQGCHLAHFRSLGVLRVLASRVCLSRSE